jgi:NADPH-dependent 2,4-dienoyl-CoA reductase/sulfur reductase-like enzyme/rhodanese-related sulfurtransferase
MTKRVLIVGGVAGGMSAATRMRRLDETAEIVVFERGEHVSFANCGLPYYVGGVIEQREDLLLQTPPSLGSRFALDVRVLTEVRELDTAGQRVLVRDLTTGSETWEPYDALILATGARPRTGMPGTGIPVHTVHTVADVDAIVAELTHHEPGAPVVIVGAGFIGVETAENLRRRGNSVTLVQRGPRPLAPLDPEMAAPIVDELRGNGVELRTEREVDRIEPRRVVLDDGTQVEAVLVVDARGVVPDTALATAAGIAIGPSGGIAVDDRQRTSAPHVWAVGDAVEKTDAVAGTPNLVTMAGLANRHGRRAADDIAGVGAPARPALGTAIIGVFGLTAAIVGWSEERLRAAGRAHRVIHTHPSTHAGYYPGADQLAMKLMVDPGTDLILGAQVVGRSGVDKRIDVLAVAMSAGLVASALDELELAYAPQYGSAKDAVNLLGYVAENVASGQERTVQWHELDAELQSGAALIDVRGPAEFERGHVPGARNIPVDRLRERLDEIERVPVIVACQVGQRGHTAARILAQNGYDVRNLDGGYLTWRAGMTSTKIPQGVY